MASLGCRIDGDQLSPWGAGTRAPIPSALLPPPDPGYGGVRTWYGSAWAAAACAVSWIVNRRLPGSSIAARCRTSRGRRRGSRDHLDARTKLLLVLTGSAVGAIEAMLGGAGPLRGRPADSLRLDPLDPWAARAFLPRLDATAFVEAYAACGGYPLHLLAWDQSATTGRNLEQLAGGAGALLLQDAGAIMGEELPESGEYARILAAIGRGRTRYNEIAGEAGQRVEHALDVLARSGFATKVVPVGAPRATRPVYAIQARRRSDGGTAPVERPA